MAAVLRRSRATELWAQRGKSFVIPALTAVALMIVAIVAMRSRPPAAAPAPPAPPAAGTFQPTADQWRDLALAKVSTAAFAEEEQTDGQIAVDDDVTTPVLPPFSGQVEQVMVQAGDRVARGQPLASVRATEVAQGQSDLATAAANLASARVQLRAAEANGARQQALLAVQGAAERDVQQAQSDLAAARSAVAADEAALAAARGRLQILGYDAGQIDALQAHPVASATALIRAPIAGVVIQRQVGVGQYLNSAANGATTPLFSIGDMSKVWLVANVREEDAARIRVGDPVRVGLPALPGRSFAAKIDYVAPALDPATHRLPVRATLDSAGGLLKPGMFADFSIVSAAGETAPAIPASAVVYDGAQPRVWVAKPDRSLALRSIKAGRSHDGLVEVLSGLAPGEQVVTAGALFIDRAAKGD